MASKWNKGDKVRSPKIEQDEDESGKVRRTSTDEIGEIIHVEHNPGYGYLYGVVFEDSGVWVTIDDANEGPDYLIAA